MSMQSTIDEGRELCTAEAPPGPPLTCPETGRSRLQPGHSRTCPASVRVPPARKGLMDATITHSMGAPAAAAEKLSRNVQVEGRASVLYARDRWTGCTRSSDPSRR